MLTAAYAIVALSCTNVSDAEKNVVTKRIQYDVPIRNSDPEMDWWVQNIEGSSREKLVKGILQQVKSGEVKVYDFLTYKPLSAEDIIIMMKHVDSVSVERSTPPYDLVDTVLVHEMRLGDISRLRFLEEWRMNEKSLVFSKNVVGICPMIERYSDSGELRGYKPLFWVFFDDKYPAELELK
jgi:hypothetical protein